MASAELARVVAFPDPGEADGALSRLRRAVDLPRLIEAGYDPAAGVIRPPPDHPVLGYALCPVVGCMSALVGVRLCFGCRQRFRRFEGTFEEFVAIPRVFGLSRRAEQRLCLVCRTPGHERPAVGVSGLCLSCDSCRRLRAWRSMSTSRARCRGVRLGGVFGVSGGPPMSGCVCARRVAITGLCSASRISRASPRCRCAARGRRAAGSRLMCLS